MKEFIEIFNKVGGKQILKQYNKNHVLVFALLQVLILGFSKKSLEIVRLSVDNIIYRKLKTKNKDFINKFINKYRNKDYISRHPKIVWTIWLQGMDEAPYIVKKCYESMKKNIKNRKIIVITEKNYTQYVNFPGFIIEKYKKGIISKVHFSDLLRIELLAKYGGTWLDGTVYCTELNDKDYILDADLFLFQCLKPGLDGHCSSISSWLMTASSNNRIILLTRALLHNYWANHDYAVDYFILHYFFQMAIEAYHEEWEKVIPFSNSTPHILLLRLFEKYNDKTWKAIKEQTSFHKLSYKFNQEQTLKNGTYYKKLFSNQGDFI